PDAGAGTGGPDPGGGRRAGHGRPVRGERVRRATGGNPPGDGPAAPGHFDRRGRPRRAPGAPGLHVAEPAAGGAGAARRTGGPGPAGGELRHSPERRDRRAGPGPRPDDGPAPGERRPVGGGRATGDHRGDRPAGEPRRAERADPDPQRGGAPGRGGAGAAVGAANGVSGAAGDARVRDRVPPDAGHELRTALAGQGTPAVRRERGGPGGGAAYG